MSDLADKIFSTISSSKDPLTAVLSKIPGFKGYLAREERRKSDKMLRDLLSQRIQEQVGRLSALQQEFISGGEIARLDELERAATRLTTFSDRIRYASRGYSGFFDAVKVDEEALNRVYTYDAAMMALVDEVANAIENIQASIGTAGVGEAIRALEKVSQDCIDTFERRKEALLKA